MRPRDRRIRPGLERVEGRELLSGITAALATSGPARPNVLDLAQNFAYGGSVQAEAGGTGGSGASSGGGNQGQFSYNSPPPIVPGPGLPLPNEIARTRFHAAFSGPFYNGAPRYTGQSKILYFRGLGTSSSFLHGDYQMALIFPRDTTQPITGAVYMQDKNINSGGQIAFDLAADPTSLDRRGRPTRLTFMEDPNIYGGAFFADTSRGTVRIRYFKDTAAVFFDGSVYTSQITNPLRNQDLQSRGGRLLPRGI